MRIYISCFAQESSMSIFPENLPFNSKLYVSYKFHKEEEKLCSFKFAADNSYDTCVPALETRTFVVFQWSMRQNATKSR